MIKILTGSDFEIREEEEKIDMCKALEDLKEEGRQEGWQEGRQDGIRKLILKILAKNQFSYEEIAEIMQISVPACRKLLYRTLLKLKHNNTLVLFYLLLSINVG